MAHNLPIAPAERAADVAAFKLWLDPQPQCRMTPNIIAKRTAVRTLLTPIQMHYAVEYYVNGRKLREIAAEEGVVPSTICRGLSRARVVLHAQLRGGATRC